MEVRFIQKRLEQQIICDTVLDMSNESNTEIAIIPNAGKRRAAWLSIAVFIFICDQISKWAILEFFVKPAHGLTDQTNFFTWYFAPAEILPFTTQKVTSFFNLVMAWNTGVSFSMFNDFGDLGAILLICFALGICGLFLFWLFKTPYHRYGLAYAMVIGGALGNVLDRARFGAVIDFLDFHAFGKHWPAFNVADMAVVSGIFLLVIVSLFFDIQGKDDYRGTAKNKEGE